MLAVGGKRKDKSVGSGDGGDLWRIFFKMSSKFFSRIENMEAQTMRRSEGDQKPGEDFRARSQLGKL